ncbi:MAG: DegV family protein [Erysipelotrichaceae bacterium]|nr:DegV family protein [Erysipelotrichaceae bacterium]
MIRILVDSASDIPASNEDNIFVVPLSVQLNGNDYIDGVNLSHNQFYELLKSTEEFPKTSQPSPQAYLNFFEQVKESKDELICILLSSGVSGTFQSGCLAKEIVDYDQIYLVDSLTGAYGVKLLVLEAQKLIQEGKSAKEIVEALENLKQKITIYLSVDTLEYLSKGGRLDKTAAFIGGIAKLKPVITVTREGKIGVLNKTIGTNRAINAIIDLAHQLEIDEEYPIYTIHTLGDKNVAKLETKLAEQGYIINEREQLGPVVGSHLGSEAFGIIFVAKNPDQIPM